MSSNLRCPSNAGQFWTSHTVRYYDVCIGPELSSGQYKTGGPLHRRKVRLWQALCCSAAFIQDDQEVQEVLTPPRARPADMLSLVGTAPTSGLLRSIVMRLPASIDMRLSQRVVHSHRPTRPISPMNVSEKTDSATSKVLEYLLEVLKEYNLANVRQYPEIMAVHLVSRVPALLDSHMLPALRTYEVRHEGLTSYVLIAAQVPWVPINAASAHPFHRRYNLVAALPLGTDHMNAARPHTHLH
eukprot:scaffold13298_cov33-Prasinocladus_malaysianus.AAC.1